MESRSLILKPVFLIPTDGKNPSKRDRDVLIKCGPPTYVLVEGMRHTTFRNSPADYLKTLHPEHSVVTVRN